VNGDISVDTVLGETLVTLARQAAERWAAGDERGTSRLAAAAWRLLGPGTFVDGDDDCTECE
jgi:hypothetical protein